MITPTIITRLQWKAYFIFMCLNLAFVPLVWSVYPETARLTLEEMDYLFTSGDVSQKTKEKAWLRTEAVMRSLNRETLYGARMHHRASFDSAMNDFEKSPSIDRDERIEKKGAAAGTADHVEQADRF